METETENVHDLSFFVIGVALSGFNQKMIVGLNPRSNKFGSGSSTLAVAMVYIT